MSNTSDIFASMVFNVGLLLAVGDKLGVGGIALMSGLSAGVNMTVNLIFAVRHKLVTPQRSDIIDLAKSLLVAGIMGCAVYAVYRLAEDGKLISFALPTIAGVIVYAVLEAVLRSEEMMGIINKVRGRK
jgi:peptidoglycan biosynthesis protein MviN/MurJ (putative lipid II flippase)